MTNLRFEHIPIIENNDHMVDLSEYPFILDPVYFQQGLSDTQKLYVRGTIADKLLFLQNGLLKEYRFKIWDPWRPRTVQGNIYRKFWDELHSRHPDWDENKLRHEVGVFVTSPDTPGRIPPHSTGGSIDLTLVYKETGNELNMGTCFDHFGPEASRDYFEDSLGDQSVRDNRRLLISAMLSTGFTADSDEWWHYDYGNQKWAVESGLKEAFYGEVIDIGAFLSRSIPSPSSNDLSAYNPR